MINGFITLYIIIIFQLLFFTLFLFMIKKNVRQNRFLGLFLFTQAMGVLHLYSQSQAADVLQSAPHLLYIGKPFILLYGPTLYLYVKSMIVPERVMKKILLHFIPFLALVLYLAITFYFRPGQVKSAMYFAGQILPVPHLFALHIFTQLQIIFYIIASLRLLHLYQKKLLDNHSSIHQKSLHWLQTFIYFYILASFLSLVSVFIASFPVLWSHIIYISMLLAFFLFYNFIVYKALINPEIFHVSIIQKYQGSTLSQELRNRYTDQIKHHMQNNKPHLNSNLKLDDLARDLSMQPWHLSQVLNQEFNQSFFDFINQYRINQARQMLSSHQTTNKTILEILYEVGFNTKASFNKAFKKHVGMTPSEYKKSQSL